ncbi:MAG: hypothetical protein ACYCSF_10185 [Acidimicrobiales bacterium]
MNALFDRLTRTVVRRGLKNGLLAGDGKWLALGAVAWLVRFLAKHQEPDVEVEELKPGERIVVTNIGPPVRGRRAKKAHPRIAVERSVPIRSDSD